MFRMGNAVKLLVSGVIVSACKSQLLAVFCVLIIAVQSSCVSFTDFLLPFLVCVCLTKMLRHYSNLNCFICRVVSLRTTSSKCLWFYAKNMPQTFAT